MKSSVAILILDKVCFRTRNIDTDNEEQVIMIRELILQKDLIFKSVVETGRAGFLGTQDHPFRDGVCQVPGHCHWPVNLVSSFVHPSGTEPCPPLPLATRDW